MAANNVFNDLVKAGQLFKTIKGSLSITGDFLSVMNFVENEFLKSAHKYNAQQHIYPSLISAKELENLDYFKSFPELANIVLHLNKDVKSATFNKSKIVATNIDLKDTNYFLTPAVCYHAYPFFRNRRFKKTPHVVVAKGSAYRYEGYELSDSPERMREFTMQEIIFFGTTEEVDSMRTELQRSVKKIAESLALNTELVEATDPFFESENNRGKVIIQRLMKAKCELIVPISKEKSIAIASFNFHGSFFTERANISKAGSKLVSGCVALGLERWAYAFFSQHGMNRNKWPDKVAKYVSHYD